MRRVLTGVVVGAVLATTVISSALMYPIATVQSEVKVTGSMDVGPADGLLTEPWSLTTPAGCSADFDTLDLAVTAPDSRPVTVASFTPDQLVVNALGGFSTRVPESVQSLMAAQNIPFVQWAPYELSLRCVGASTTKESWNGRIWFTSDWTFQATDPAKGVTGSASAWSAAQADRSSGSGALVSTLISGISLAAAQSLGMSLGVNFTGVVSNTVLPTISGAGTVGALMTCSEGTWGGSPTSKSFAWIRAGRAINAATNATYTLVTADVGQRISCQVTARSLVNSRMAESTSITAAWPAITAVTLPTIAGTVSAGQQVTCNAGTWSETTSTEAFTWALNGTAVTGARSKTLNLTGAQVGGSLTCTIAVTSTRGAAGSATSAAVTVNPAPLTVLAAASIVGTPTVGQQLTCQSGVYSDTITGETFTWAAGGVTIANATSRTFTPTSVQGGAAVTCSIRATASVNRSVVTTSAAVTIARPALTSTSAPKITGTVKVNETVTCTSGTWSDTVTGETIQWFLGTTAIKGATSKTYLIPTTAAGSSLSCSTTASAAGNRTATAKTAASTVALDDPLVTSALPTISGTASVGSTLTATAPKYTPVATSVAYQWYSNGTAIKGATNGTYKIVAADKGKTLTVKTVGSAAGYQDSAQSAASVGKKVA